MKTGDTKVDQSTIGHRSFLAASLATSVAAAAFGQARDYRQDSQPERYPDRDILALDKRFGKYKIGNTPIQRLHNGTLWAEGPAWNSGGGYLIWSDIPNDI